MTALKWQHEMPNAPGWWWVRFDGGEPEVIRVRSSVATGFSFTLSRPSCNEPLSSDDWARAEFAGPMEAPQ